MSTSASPTVRIVTYHHADGSEPRRFAQELSEALQAFGRCHRTALSRLAECVNVGDLVEAEGLRRRLGQGDALLAAVIHGNEEGGGEHHDPRSPHAVGRRDPAKVQLRQRRLLAAGHVRLPETEHEVEQDARVGYRRFSLHDRES
jgi:hypothetical protein